MAPISIGTGAEGCGAAEPERFYGQALAAAGIALWEAWEPGLKLISFRGGTESAWPLSAAQTAAGMSWDENIYPADRAKLRSYFQQPGVIRTQGSIDYRLIVGEGELLWVRHWTLSRTPAAGGRHRLVNAIMPIPEQKHLEWECLRVSERECNRIGQELHDDLCQVLAGLAFMMRVIEQRAHKIDPAFAAEIEELNTHLAGATDRVRSMAHGLFPARLHFACLRDALTALAVEVRTVFRIEASVDLARGLPRHSPEQIIHVYRIVQEAVSNAVRHGKATSVKIHAEHHRGSMQVCIADNGSGFAAANTRPEGIGMHVMQYRARILGGTFAIDSLSPAGVAVRIAYPIRNPNSVSSPPPDLP